MLDLEKLADALMSGDGSGAELEQLRSEVEGLAVGSRPSEAAMRFRAISAVDHYWHSLPKTNGVADVIKVDPMEIQGALGSVSLVDVKEGGREFSYRLFGSRVADVIGFDMTGRRVNEIPTTDPILRFFHAGFLGVVKHRRPLFTTHMASNRLMVGKWHRLQLPLGEGGEVRQLMVCAVATRPDGLEK